MPIIDNETGFPDESPCPECGWPLYCCLCKPCDCDGEADCIFCNMQEETEAQ